MTSLAGLSLRDLDYAVAVAQTRHFGRAAERCGVSQPALSEQVRKLEALLGVVLFERGRRGVQVTPEGQALLTQAERVLAEAHGLVEMAGGAAEPLARTLRLSAIQTLGPYYLPHLVRQVRAAYPKLALRLEEGRTAPLLDSLRAGGTDLVLAALPLPRDTTAAIMRAIIAARSGSTTRSWAGLGTRALCRSDSMASIDCGVTERPPLNRVA